MNRYEEKQEARRERLEEAADKARARADAASKRSHDMMDAIPFGQPILVGHHSEKRDRRYRDRAWNLMGRSVEENKKAADYERRAASVGTAGVSSDDPEAPDKLQAKVEQLEALQARMKAANAAIRKAGVKLNGGPDPTDEQRAAAEAALIALGFKADQAIGLLAPDFCGRRGFADYATKNNGSNIRRIKERIAGLQRQAATPANDPIDGDGWRIFDDLDENRTCIEFDAKPTREIVVTLKRAGFRWAYHFKRWQRMRSTGAWWAAKRAMGVDA